MPKPERDKGRKKHGCRDLCLLDVLEERAEIPGPLFEGKAARISLAMASIAGVDLVVSATATPVGRRRWPGPQARPSARCGLAVDSVVLRTADAEPTGSDPDRWAPRSDRAMCAAPARVTVLTRDNATQGRSSPSENLSLLPVASRLMPLMSFNLHDTHERDRVHSRAACRSWWPHLLHV